MPKRRPKKRKAANPKPPKKKSNPRRRKAKPRDYYLVIRGRLDQAEAKAERAKVESIIMGPVRNADRSIMGEIRFIRPAGLDSREFVIDVEAFLSVPRGVWISVGGRFEPSSTAMDHVRDPATSRYEREQGLINIGSFFRRGQSKAHTFLAARDYLQQMEETIKRKVLEVYVRLQYQPKDNQPSRIGTPISKRRKPRAKKSRRSSRVSKRVKGKVTKTRKPSKHKSRKPRRRT